MKCYIASNIITAEFFKEKYGIHLPEGCLGFNLVYKTKTSARKAHGKNVLLTEAESSDITKEFILTYKEIPDMIKKEALNLIMNAHAESFMDEK